MSGLQSFISCLSLDMGQLTLVTKNMYEVIKEMPNAGEGSNKVPKEKAAIMELVAFISRFKYFCRQGGDKPEGLDVINRTAWDQLDEALETLDGWEFTPEQQDKVDGAIEMVDNIKKGCACFLKQKEKENV